MYMSLFERMRQLTPWMLLQAYVVQSLCGDDSSFSSKAPIVKQQRASKQDTASCLQRLHFNYKVHRKHLICTTRKKILSAFTTQESSRVSYQRVPKLFCSIGQSREFADDVRTWHEAVHQLMDHQQHLPYVYL